MRTNGYPGNTPEGTLPRLFHHPKWKMHPLLPAMDAYIKTTNSIRLRAFYFDPHIVISLSTLSIGTLAPYNRGIGLKSQMTSIICVPQLGPAAADEAVVYSQINYSEQREQRPLHFSQGQ